MMQDSLILWNKEAGETSFQSLGKIKKILGTRKVGHTGTLDKFAQGLMLVLSGRLTRLNPIFSSMDKSYRGEILFGEESDTLDPGGKIIQRADPPSLEQIEEALPGFLGAQQQIPPLFSAIHVNGKRAWKRALDGEEVEMAPRDIEIFSLKIVEWKSPILTLDIHCSKGTYIRSLARDLGHAVGSCARLEGLTRTSVGPFRLDEKNPKPTELFQLGPEELSHRMDGLYSKRLDDSMLGQVAQGKELKRLFTLDDFPQMGHYFLMNSSGVLAAVVLRTDRGLKYLFVVPAQD